MAQSLAASIPPATPSDGGTTGTNPGNLNTAPDIEMKDSANNNIALDAKMNDASKPSSSPLSSAQSDRGELPEPRLLTPAEKRALAPRKMIETKKRKKEALLAAGAPPMSGSEASTSTRKSRDSSKRPGMSGPSGHSPPKKRIKSRSANDASDDANDEELEEPGMGMFTN